MFVLSSLMFLSQSVSAADPVVLTGFRSYGTGCTNNSLVKVISEDFSSMSLLFSNMNVEDGYGGSRRCVGAFEIDLPPGQQLVITSLQYRGYVNLGPNAVANMRSVPFFNNGSTLAPQTSKDRKGRPSTKMVYSPGVVFSGGFREAIGLAPDRGNSPVEQDIFWEAGSDKMQMISPCGGKTTLYVVSDISVQSMDGEPVKAFATYDTTDLPVNRGKGPAERLPGQRYRLRMGACEHNPKIVQPPAYIIENAVKSDE